MSGRITVSIKDMEMVISMDARRLAPKYTLAELPLFHNENKGISCILCGYSKISPLSGARSGPQEGRNRAAPLHSQYSTVVAASVAIQRCQALLYHFTIFSIQLEADKIAAAAARSHRRGAAAHERVEHHAARRAGRLDHSLDDFERLLGRVVGPLRMLAV